ncbi:GntR family transcriptional regulator [Vreelandella olivaria]|uniref:GntR family transcriptional regulator n=1 Tax=Vreelandella olivaria TaxID=390919 RepID=A0ABN5X5R9_9GAMM|nr:GntR family transcriptional regulator [Halomonas olivaria]
MYTYASRKMPMSLVEKIRMEILEGRYAPGSMLHQAALAAKYEVSRIPVRDALQALANEKLVHVIPGKGARVISLTSEELDEIYDLRVTLECDLLERAINLANNSDHMEVSYALKKSSLEAGRPGWQAGDWQFHRALYLPARRPRQLAIVEELRTSCALYASNYEKLSSETNRWLDDHEAIVRAFVNGLTEEASSILRSHIIASRAKLDPSD